MLVVLYIQRARGVTLSDDALEERVSAVVSRAIAARAPELDARLAVTCVGDPTQWR